MVHNLCSVPSARARAVMPRLCSQPVANASVASRHLVFAHKLNEPRVQLVSTNWEHTMYGAFVPLLVGLYESGACAPVPCHDRTCGCQCGPVTLLLPTWSPRLIAKQLALLPSDLINVTLVAAGDYRATQLAGSPSTELLRCDEPMPRHCSRLLTRGVTSSCVSQCTHEGAWFKARRMLSGLLPSRQALDFQHGQRERVGAMLSHHVLITKSRCGACARGKLPMSRDPKHVDCWVTNAHHRMCLDESDPKLAGLLSALGRLGRRVTWELFDPALRPFAEQMERVCAANTVLLQHGASLANALWSRPSTRWVEITPYLLGNNTADMLRYQALYMGRDVLQQVVRGLAPSHRLEHVAVPGAPKDWANPTPRSDLWPFIGGQLPYSTEPLASRRCWSWSCLQPAELAKLLLLHLPYGVAHSPGQHMG